MVSLCSAKLPPPRSIKSVHVQADVRLRQSGGVVRRAYSARAAVALGFLHKHLLDLERRRAATHRMRGVCTAAIRAVENNVIMVFGSVDSGSPADLGGGDGAAVAGFIKDHVDRTVRIEGDGSYAHGFDSSAYQALLLTACRLVALPATRPL